MATVDLTRQRSRFWQLRWRPWAVALLVTWAAVLSIGMVSIGVRSWLGDTACEAPSPSDRGESHWSYRDFGHYCTYRGVQTTEPSGLGRVWIATVAVGAVAVAGSVAACVTPPRR